MTHARSALLGVALFLVGLFAWPVYQAQASTPAVQESVLFNDAATADTDLFGADLRPPESHPVLAYRITISVVSTNTVVNWVTTSGATELVEDLNGGTALTAGNIYTFVLGGARTSTASEALSYNMRVETTTTIGRLQVDRIEDGGL